MELILAGLWGTSALATYAALCWIVHRVVVLIDGK